MKLKISKDKIPAFTLIETLIAVSMMAVIGLAVFAVFSSSIKIWHRLNNVLVEEDVSITLATLGRDLRNSFVFSSVPFEGSGEKLVFATIIYNIDKKDLKESIGKVEYYLDKKTGELRRQQYNYSQICKRENIQGRALLKNLNNLHFYYYYPAKETGKYVWNDSIKEGVPSAIKVILEANQAFAACKRERIFPVYVNARYAFSAPISEE